MVFLPHKATYYWGIKDNSSWEISLVFKKNHMRRDKKSFWKSALVYIYFVEIVGS